MFKKNKKLRLAALLAALVLVAAPATIGMAQPKTATPPASDDGKDSIIQRAEALPPPPALAPATVELEFSLVRLLASRLPFSGYKVMTVPRPSLEPGPVANPTIDTLVNDWKLQLASQKAAVTAEKAAADAEKAATEKTAADKAAAEKAAAEKAAADKAAAEKPKENEPTEEDPKEETPVAPPEEELPATGGNLNSMQQNGMILTSDLRSVAPDYTGSQTVPSGFFDAISGKKQISESEFKSLARQFKLSGQYVQRFIDDAFVYRMGSDYKYFPVDFSLKQHRYNWNNLEHSSGEDKDFVVNGTSRVSKGVDVSSHQGNINWNKVKADGIDFAYIRLGYTGYGSGVISLDEKFDQNMQGAINAGVKVGVYYYSQAISKSEAVNEANFVLDAVQGYDMDLPVAFDIEGGQDGSWRTYNQSIQTMTNVTKAFMGTIEKAGHSAILYSYSKYLTEHVDLTQLTQYDVWMAQYYYVPFFPYNFKIWQYSCTGRVAGITGNVDLNMMFQDYKH